MTDEVEELLRVLGPFYELIDEKKKITQISDLSTGAFFFFSWSQKRNLTVYNLPLICSARLTKFARQLEGKYATMYMMQSRICVLFQLVCFQCLIATLFYIQYIFNSKLAQRFPNLFLLWSPKQNYLLANAFLYILYKICKIHIILYIVVIFYSLYNNYYIHLA